jgi:3-hydroxyacyl-[acyl-carrier-protein] dehydratase
MSLDEIHAAIPHRAPFLLVDEILERSDQRIRCRKTFRPDEWYFAGHYPGHPITPGVILCEAAMQAGAILLSHSLPPAAQGLPVAARMNDVRFKRIVRPGETVDIEVDLIDRIATAWQLKAKVLCGDKVAVRFDFTCTVVPDPADSSVDSSAHT